MNADTVIITKLDRNSKINEKINFKKAQTSSRNKERTNVGTGADVYICFCATSWIVLRQLISWTGMT